jgi:hypothetical protein
VYTGKVITWEQALNDAEDTMPKNLTIDMALECPPVPKPGNQRLTSRGLKG